MNRLRRCVISCVAAALGLAGSAWADDGSWVGKRIMIKRGDITIGHAEKGVNVDDATLDEMAYTVEAEKEPWIKVRQRSVSGWFAWSDAVLLDDAVDYFTDLIRDDPKDDYAYAHRAWAWKEKGELDIALKDFNEAIRLDPEAACWRLDRGVVWYDKKEYDKAIADYDEAIRLDPRYARAFNNRGFARHAKKEYDKAITNYDEAIHLDPKDPLAFHNRGLAWSNKQEFDKAIQNYDEAIRLDPKHAFAHFNRAVAQMLTRRPQAVRGFQALIDLQGWKGELAPYAVVMGHFAARQGREETAAKRLLADSAGKLTEDWPYPAVRFLREEIDEGVLLGLATDADKRTEARCYLALDHVLKGRKNEALVHFRWVKEHGTVSFTEYTIALAELERLERGEK
jgi:tetratricopeptide (TPR) repeat protein